MNSYSFYISGDVVIMADTLDTAEGVLVESLSEVLSDWTIEATYENGEG